MKFITISSYLDVLVMPTKLLDFLFQITKLNLYCTFSS